MKKSAPSLLAISLILILSACGKNPYMDEQQSQRDAFAPAISGNWATVCHGSTIDRLTFANNTFTIERDNYLDEGCQNLSRSTSQTGTFLLMDNFKQGINDSVVFTPNGTVTVTLYRDTDLVAQNAALISFQNQTLQSVSGDTPDQALPIEIANQKLLDVKQLSSWNKAQAKTLTREQAEELNQGDSQGDAALSVQPQFDYFDHTSVQYQLDNGMLQFPSGGGDLGSVYVKQ